MNKIYEETAKEVRNFFINRYSDKKIKFKYDPNTKRYYYFMNDKMFLNIDESYIIDFRDRFVIEEKKSFIDRIKEYVNQENPELLTGDIYLDHCMINHRNNKPFDDLVLFNMRNMYGLNTIKDDNKMVIEYARKFCQKKKDELDKKQGYFREIDGIKYEIKGDNIDFLMKSAIYVKRVIDLVNPTLRKYMGTVKLHGYRDPFETYWDLKYKSSGKPFMVYATGGVKEINLYEAFLNDVMVRDPKSFLGTLYHEIGHSIDHYYKGMDLSSNPAWKYACYMDKKFNGYDAVSNYGLVDVGEDFADTVMDLFLYPESFSKQYPYRTEYLCNLLKVSVETLRDFNNGVYNTNRAISR